MSPGSGICTGASGKGRRLNISGIAIVNSLFVLDASRKSTPSVVSLQKTQREYLWFRSIVP